MVGTTPAPKKCHKRADNETVGPLGRFRTGPREEEQYWWQRPWRSASLIDLRSQSLLRQRIALEADK